jgi:excisionase family DNA binding protein
MSDPYLTTAEVAELLRVSAATVRRWADDGILPAERTVGGHRRFTRSAVEALVRPRAPAASGAVDRWISDLLHPDGLSLDAALLAARSRAEGWFSVAEAIGTVLEELGCLWEQGILAVADEHVASERLARSLARAADTLPVRAGAAPIALATPEGEFHTLGLSLVELCVREWGWPTLWLGRDTPSAELERCVCTKGRVGAVALSASAHSEPARLAEVAERLGAACRKESVRLIAGGRGVWPDPLPHGELVRSFGGLRMWLARVDRGFAA